MPYKYIGAGRVVAGIPACDLDESELPEAERDALIAMFDAGDSDEGPTPVYKKMTKAEAKAFYAEREAEAKRRAGETPDEAPGEEG